MPIDLLCALEPEGRGRDLKRRLEHANVSLAAPRMSDLRSALRTVAPDLVVASTGFLPDDIEGWIAEIRELPEGPDVVLLHDGDDTTFRAAMIRAGCLGVLDANLASDELAETLQALVARRLNHIRLAIRATGPAERSSLEDFVSESPRMQEFLRLARKLVDADSSMLLLGETGTGKERLARAVHEEGPRAGGPFVAVNCGAFPETLLESELFGHEKGAFTGAARARRGYFEQADEGTLFLDEIGELPLHLQVKLLRVLEERRVRRLGAERPFPVDVRLMAATNRDLEQEVEAGRFRRDLYYRLAVVTLTLPPLRERVEDIPALIETYIEHFRIALNRPIFGVQAPALEAMTRYRWPGNVRELINVVERAVLLSPGPEVGLVDLPRAISSMAPDSGGGATGAVPTPTWRGKRLTEARHEVVGAFERAYLTDVLRATGGRIGESARRAGLSERSLYELMQRHGLRKEDFRPRPGAAERSD